MQCLKNTLYLTTKRIEEIAELIEEEVHVQLLKNNKEKQFEHLKLRCYQMKRSLDVFKKTGRAGTYLELYNFSKNEIKRIETNLLMIILELESSYI